ncbi:type VI secretion system-associated FHA domain protein [Vibrio aestuarianus]|uniref:type VI secretion system-associated FHA domain protein n=1 Tax=Vibrio aestuarianus TaxID=28171 RepID=UPI0021C40823|nr:FHA domain-containing protein [Vibrio aestuarianus]MDE1211235.1 FHA domain-containing protein [Vibrio aestuarianus]MDE1254705.1 FHA domain-containing protein [Vibrio aestuarianus]MDE1319549.1 FHA domain-containing protein [Vibrio aestuarianus]CAH8242286.1 FHA domain-containing protein [Vibrio aestuarianus]
MPLSIRIISSPDGESIAEWNKSFPEDGGDIGRAFGATMQLSDSTREVSSKHAMIKKSDRGYQVMDTSTNGVFINGATAALGKGNQSTLNDGDVLDIGRYRLLVSCFLPEKAKAQNIDTQDMSNSIFGDDPFGSESEAAEVELSQPVATPESAFSTRREEVVEDDPFESDMVHSRRERQEFNLSFSAIDDDPLAESDIQSVFPNNESIMGSDDFISSSYSPSSVKTMSPVSSYTVQNQAVAMSQFGNHNHSLALSQHQVLEEHFQQQTEKALKMALNRLLSDIEPQALESMFDDLMPPRFWQSKPKYWDMYKRYFNRQMDNRDWQIKFNAYFQDAMRLQKSLENEK